MGFGAILGGALAGVGKGMAEKGAADLAQRHKEAMAALEHGYKTDEIKTQYEQADVNAARNDERDLKKSLTLQHDSQRFTQKIGEASAKAQADAAEQDRRFKANEAALDRAAKLEELYGKPAAEYRDEVSGNVTQIWTKPGGKREQVVLQGVARKPPKASSSPSDDDPLGIRGGGSGGANHPSIDSFYKD